METKVLVKTKIVTVAMALKVITIKKLIVTGVGLLAILLIILYIASLTGNRIPPAGPSKEEQAGLDNFYNKCKFFSAYNDSLGFPEDAKFKLASKRCSEEFDSTVREGEEIKIEILTNNYDEGIKEFRNWLKDNDLVESDKLRVIYIYKPKE